MRQIYMHIYNIFGKNNVIPYTTTTVYGGPDLIPPTAT